MLSNAAGQVMADGVTRALRLVSRPGDSPIKDSALHYAFSMPEDETLVLTAAQVDTVNALFSDPRMAPLIEASCLAILVLDRRAGLLSAETSIESKFSEMFSERLERDGMPPDTALLLWRFMRAQLNRLLGEGLRESLTSEERNQLLGADDSLTLERDKLSELPAWLSHLLDVSTDRERLISLKIRGDEIRRQALSQFGKLELRHSLDGSEGRPLASLYIDRTLQSPDGGQSSSDDTFATTTRGRLVVTGPPGNGKSTLTQHLIASLSSNDQGYVPLLLRAREADLDTILLTHELTDSIRRLFQDPHIQHDHIEDMLCLGRAVVIFDGLDEILDKGKRRNFVAKIEAFSNQYPLCTVLATSRENGYDDAPFSKTFTKYKLLPFSEPQVREYAGKWFRPDPGGATLTQTFLRDVQPVEELAQNPLMLSLLCILYRNRGYIPRNRRAVYKDCADLLFRRWDSMRDIEQPTDHVEHGEDLMEEIALFFFNSQTAQSGVQERQLQGIIAGYLEDSAGVLPAQAKYRAKQFLNFCADRAWLLGVDGTEAGERLFSFTHRTFMEYFAAEGMVRTKPDAGHLADVIIREYQKNASSVLPDLVVMAAEAGTRGRVRDVLEEIKKKERLIGGRGEGRFLPLRMRIASVLNLQPRHFDLLMTEAFAALEKGWDDALSLEVAEALFRLPRNPRGRIEAFVMDPAALNTSPTPQVLRQRQELLIRAWVEHELESGETVRGHEWADVLEKCWETYLSAGPTKDRWIRFYQRFYRNESVLLPKGDLAWVMHRAKSRTYGPYCIAALRAIEGRDTASVADILSTFNSISRPSNFNPRDAYFVAGGVMNALDSRRAGTPAVTEDEWKLVVSAAMVWWEVHGRYDEFAETLDEVLGMPFAALVVDRERILATNSNLPEKALPIPAVSQAVKARVRKQLKGACGEWAVRWTQAGYDLILPEAKGVS